MKHETVFASVRLMKGLLYAAVSAGLVFGFVCFSCVDIDTSLLIDFGSSFPFFMLLQLGILVIFHCFARPVSLFLQLLFIFAKSFTLSFLLKFCIVYGLLFRELVTVVLTDLLVVAFASSNLKKTMCSIF